MIRKTIKELYKKSGLGVEPGDIILREIWWFLFIPIYIKDSWGG